MNLGYIFPKVIGFTISFILFLGFPLNTLALNESVVLAGGCFWCLEHDLEDVGGVISVQSGYTGGAELNPNYQSHKGHQEAVIVKFDLDQISYEKLLRSYWHNIDPLDGGGQFCDRGDSYRPVIFTRTESQRNDATQSVTKAAKELKKTTSHIKVQIKDAKEFWLAENYHQDFASANPLKYNFYRFSCGRDNRLDELWAESARTDKEWQN